MVMFIGKNKKTHIKIRSSFASMLLFIVFSLSAAPLKVKYQDGRYKIVNSRGESLCNYVLDFAVANENCKTFLVVPKSFGNVYLLNDDGKVMCVFENIKGYKTFDNCFAIQDSHYKYSVYDYNGNKLLDNCSLISDIECERPDGSMCSLISVYRDQCYELFTPDMRPTGIIGDSEYDKYRHLLKVASRGAYDVDYYDMSFKLLLSNIDKMQVSPKEIISYYALPKEMQSILTMAQYVDMKIYMEKDDGAKVARFYTQFGALMATVPCKKKKKDMKLHEPDKIYKSNFKKYILPYFLNSYKKDEYRLLEVPYQEFCKREFAMSSSKPVAATATTLAQVMKKELPFVFPTLSEAEETADSPKEVKRLGAKLKSNKYGKITGYERKVAADGFIYYDVKYANGKVGLLDRNGNPLTPSTSNMVTYSNIYGVIQVCGNKYDAKQLYSHEGRLYVDLEKEGYSNGTIHRCDDGRVYYKVEKGDKKGVLDYFGDVLIAPVYDDIIFSSNVFEYKNGSNWISTGVALANYSRPGGKKPVPVKQKTSNTSNSGNAGKVIASAARGTGSNKRSVTTTGSKSSGASGRTVKSSGVSRPGRGVLDTGDRLMYYFTSDYRRGILLKSNYNSQLGEYYFSIFENRFQEPCYENMMVTAETDDYWVLSNVTFGMFRKNLKGDICPGYTMFLAKDWSWVMVSPYVDDIYSVQVTESKYNELDKKCVPTESKGPTPMRTANMQAIASITKAATEANIERIRAKRERQDAEYEEKRSARLATQTASKVNPVEIVKYPADYTPGKYIYWCEKCQNWGPNHLHTYVK